MKRMDCPEAHTPLDTKSRRPQVSDCPPSPSVPVTLIEKQKRVGLIAGKHGVMNVVSTSDKFGWRRWPPRNLDCCARLRCDLRVRATRFDDADGCDAADG